MSCAPEALWSKPTLSRFVYYKLMTLIPVSAALIGIYKHEDWILWSCIYIGLCLLHAAIMNAVKCPHCTYYKMGEKTYSCFIWWKTPRLYAPRNGPESGFVAIYVPFGMLVLTAFPIYWLWHQWGLLFLYILSIIVLVLSFAHNECPRCLNFDCGNNTVSEKVKKEFLQTRE